MFGQQPPHCQHARGKPVFVLVDSSGKTVCDVVLVRMMGHALEGERKLPEAVDQILDDSLPPFDCAYVFGERIRRSASPSR